MQILLLLPIFFLSAGPCDLRRGTEIHLCILNNENKETRRGNETAEGMGGTAVILLLLSGDEHGDKQEGQTTF